MKDRIVQYPNRYKLTQVSGDIYDLTPEPGVVTEPGTPLNKANLLSDSTALKLGLNPADDPTVDDALATGGWQIGDIRYTLRTDLDENWALPNGDLVFKEQYPALWDTLPDNTWTNRATFSIPNFPGYHLYYLEGYWITVQGNKLSYKLGGHPHEGGWTTITISDATYLGEIMYINNTWVSYYNSRVFYSSSLAGPWSSTSLPNSSVRIKGIVYAFGKWAVGGYTSYYDGSGSGWLYTADTLGGPWTEVIGYGSRIHSLDFINGYFILGYHSYNSSTYTYSYTYKYSTGSFNPSSSFKYPAGPGDNIDRTPKFSYIDGYWICAPGSQSNSNYNKVYYSAGPELPTNWSSSDTIGCYGVKKIDGTWFAWSNEYVHMSTSAAPTDWVSYNKFDINSEVHKSGDYFYAGGNGGTRMWGKTLPTSTTTGAYAYIKVK